MTALGEPETIEGVRAERDAASARCRELETELGAMRGRVRSFERAMWRRTAQRRLVAHTVRRFGKLLSPRS